MRFGPVPNHLPATLWQVTFDQIELVELHDGYMLSIFDVEMRWWMLPIDQEHPNYDPIKAADLRH
jgi:hypothetical protein